jgi:hypothetical protein
MLGYSNICEKTRDNVLDGGSMDKRPELDLHLSAEVFKSFYYLKEELVNFCRAENLQTTGSKEELTERIACFLTTGARITTKRKAKASVNIDVILPDSIIEPNFTCTEKHRAFFKSVIGSQFSFPVAFQNWLKENTGKTYKEAIDAYYNILKMKKNTKTKIDKQFEYNTYIRDFFADNKGRTLDEAIICWKYKKSQQGDNCYRKPDLEALNREKD